VQLIEQLGGDPQAARVPSERLDLDAAAQWLITERGIPETQLQITEYKASVSRRKADQAQLSPVKASAGATALQFGTTP
ncbi:MAG: hypothetical protein V2J55_02345, partial [Candidatus Competibacteraceae bacterium]|jgi:hypothetical protein|nr:hypothetical protein [Candidatus Competibacteraceae bacterium]